MENIQTISNNNSKEITGNTVWNFARHTECLDQIGKQFPADFLKDISDMAFDLVLDWLHKNNAPEEIITLMDNGYCLELLVRPGGNDVDQRDRSEVPAMVSQIIEMLYKSGHYIEPESQLYKLDAAQ